MKAVSAGLVMLLAAAGCAGLQTAGSAGMQGRGLDAYLVPFGGMGGLTFNVNRPAYVAVFRIDPSYGTSLVYPRPGFGDATRESRAGATLISRTALNASGRDLARTHLASFRPATSTPTFFFMIASEEPLDLSDVGAYGSNLPWALGTAYASGNAYQTMEAVSTLLVPNVESTDWVTDYYVSWPQAAPRNNPRSDLVPLACNGEVIWVPLNWIDEVDRTLCSAEDEEASQDSTTAPTGTDERRVPPTAGERITSSQLSDPEGFEQRRREVERFGGRAFDRFGSDFGGDEEMQDRADRLRRPGSMSRDSGNGQSSGSGRASARSSGQPSSSAPRGSPPAASGAAFGSGGDEPSQ